MAEAAIAAAAAMTGMDSDQGMNDDNFSATTALVAFLRMEADLADEKAKRLRAQAATLAQKFGVSEARQEAYELHPNQLPPLDENGLPKYKGKKRGRKPKERKRKSNPNRRKRQHTAYTLFVQETYPGVKAANPELPSKDVISIVAKRWGNGLTAEEKKEWKARAQATHEGGESLLEEDDAAVAAAAAAVEDVDDDEEEDEIDEIDEEEEEEEETETDMLKHESVAGEPLEEVIPPARRSKRSRK